MKKTASHAALSKLTLNRETLVELTSSALEEVAGGNATAIAVSSPKTKCCPGPTHKDPKTSVLSLGCH